MPGAATIFGTILTMLKGNVSGQVQQLPAVTLNGGRERVVIETIALAAQAAGSRIAVARIPVGAALLGITVVSDQAPGALTLAFGDYNTDAIYSAAAAPGAANVPAVFVAAGTYGVPIVTGYDSVDGKQKGYEDIIMTTAAAALAATGIMRVVTRYVLD